MAGDGAERVVRGFALMHDDAMEVTANAESDDPPTEKDTPMADASGSRGFASPSNDKDKDKDGAGRPFRSRKPKPKSTRICALCPSQKASAPYGLSAHVEPSIARGGTIPPPMGEFAGPFLKDKNNIKTTYAHQNCIMWCPEVYFCANKDGLKHVEDGIKRGNKLKCAHCGKKGAAVGCMLPACNRTYHLKCAHATGCRFNAEKFVVVCPVHKSAKKTPAPVWSKTMNGDEALAVTTANHFTAPAVAGDKSGATPLLERLAIGAGPAPNASGRPINRRVDFDRVDFDFDTIDEDEVTELGFNRPSKGMTKVERTRGVIASVVAANARLKAEKERLNDDEQAFATREENRFTKDKGKIECVTVGGSFGGGGAGGGQENALGGGFETLAGMEPEIKVLKELALLPLTYPEIFEKLGVPSGRGVLLHGPPGTGKTAAVRALLGHAAKGPHPVNFFSRKGADALGKYMGEAERSLRLLFEEAKRRQPSIIFFDEIDGLAPSRKRVNGEQDAIHGSVVATLLALMDGLDDRGRVVVIGATNRPDAVDPALRRPGRFDREIRFGLPGPVARGEILKVHTRAWTPKPPTDELLTQIANKTEGAAGADLRALASAATLAAVRRRLPSLLNGDTTRDVLAASLEPYLPVPVTYLALKETANETANTAGHRGAQLAVREMRALGTRVEVFWSGNDLFFPGTVTGFDKASMAHRITYDDGETQWLTLWREGEVVRWVDDHSGGENGETSGGIDPVTTDGVTGGATTTPLTAGAVTPPTTASCAATTPPTEKNSTAVQNTPQAKRAADALAAAEASAATYALASKRALHEIRATRPDSVVVSCKRRFGVFLPRKQKQGKGLHLDESERDATVTVTESEKDTTGSHLKESVSIDKEKNSEPVVGEKNTERGDLIACLCASCIAGPFPKNAIFHPRQWEQHCGAGTAKKWKLSVRVELGFTKLGDCSSEVPSVSVPIGRWFAMNEGKTISIEDALTHVQAKNSYFTSQVRGQVGQVGQVGHGSVNRTVNDTFEDDFTESGSFDVPFDVARAQRDALALRFTFELAERAARKRGGGFRVTSSDWATALATTTQACSRRSASSGALSTTASALSTRVVPVLGRAVCSVLISLRDARLPLDVFARRAADRFLSLGDSVSNDLRNTVAKNWTAAEATLREAGLLDDGGRGGRPISADCLPIRDDASEARGDDDDDDDESQGGVTREEAVTAATDAAAAVSGGGADGTRPRSCRILVSGDGQLGQTQVIGCLLHALQGVPCVALSLASLIAQGEGDAAVGVVKALREPLRCAARAPSLVHVTGLETWAVIGVNLGVKLGVTLNASQGEVHGVDTEMETDSLGIAPSQLWDIFEQTVGESEAGSGEDGCLVVVADCALPLSALPDRIQRFFGRDVGDTKSSDRRRAHAGGAGADATSLALELERPSPHARASVIARASASIMRCAVVPALASALAADVRKRHTMEADDEASLASARKRRKGFEEPVTERDKNTEQSAAEEWRRIQRLRVLTETLASKKAALLVLTRKAKAARDFVCAGVAYVASAIASTKRFKPALKETSSKTQKSKNTFRAVLKDGAAGEYSVALVFFEALRKSAGTKYGQLDGNKPNKSAQATHVPTDFGAAVSAALDQAAAMLLSPHAVRDEKTAAAAEVEALIARTEVGKALQEVADCAAEGVVTAERLTVTEGAPARVGLEATATATAGEHFGTDMHAANAVPSTPATPREPGASLVPSSVTPSAKALKFASAVVDQVRLASVSNDDIADAAAALAEFVVRGVDDAMKTNSGAEENEQAAGPGLGSIDRCLGTVACLLTRAARDARGGGQTCLGLVRENRGDILKACAACVAEQA